MISNVTQGGLSQNPVAFTTRSTSIPYTTAVHDNGYKHELAGPFLCSDKDGHVVLPKSLPSLPP
jgi:hypothetical protein